MKKILPILLLVFCSTLFSAEVWFTIDKSQYEEVSKITKEFFPEDEVKIFFWDNGLTKMKKLIKKGKKPNVLLTGHTFVPSIANIDSSFNHVEPLFLDIRTLYVWGYHKSLPVSRWRDVLYYAQSHTDFISFPKTWTSNKLYNFLSFFNDQLPFWISQTPFSPQNMIYTVKLMYTLMDNYPRLFQADPTDSFLKKKNKAIISGVWMHNLLKEKKEQFSVYDVPKSQNGVRGFKGAYVAMYYDNSADTTQIRNVLNSYNFQNKTWKAINLLPTNSQLRKHLSANNPHINKLYKIADYSPWATAIDPKKLDDRTAVLNFLLKNKKNYHDKDENKITKFFTNKTYFKFMKLLH